MVVIAILNYACNFRLNTLLGVDKLLKLQTLHAHCNEIKDVAALRAHPALAVVTLNVNNLGSGKDSKGRDDATVGTGGHALALIRCVCIVT